MIPTMTFKLDSVCRLCTKGNRELQFIFTESSNLCLKIRNISPKLQLEVLKRAELEQELMLLEVAFDKHSTAPELAKKLRKVLEQKSTTERRASYDQIFVGDGLPAQVCNKCAQQVHSYCDFRQQCEESDAAFRHYLSSHLNNQHMMPKSRLMGALGPGDEPLLIKEESVTCVLEEVKEEPAADNSPEYREGSAVIHVNEDSLELREVRLPESRDFEIESVEIKNDVTGFLSEKLNQELDTSNEVESREQSDGGNEDTDLEEKKYDINELDSVQQNEYKCETCSEVFTSKESQQQHKCTTPYRCLICMQVLTNEADLCTHMLKHNNEPCRLCGKTFSAKTYYMKHLRAHSGLGHRCNYCNKLFPSFTNFNIHVRKHTGEKPYICEICGESFARIQGYQCHLRKHTGERPFQCPTCLNTFLSKNTLQNHIRIHTGEKPYVCEICGNNFGDKPRLWHHMKNVHTLKEKKFKCSSCPKEYASNSKLKAHFRIHTGERPFACHICGRTFTLRPCLTKHLDIHTGEKPHGCTFCNKKFSSVSSRDRHVRTHTGETPFGCATCDKAFLLRRDLINHVFKFQH